MLGRLTNGTRSARATRTFARTPIPRPATGFSLFASVMASEFVTLQEFGALTAGTMVLCALTDLTFTSVLALEPDEERELHCIVREPDADGSRRVERCWERWPTCRPSSPVVIRWTRGRTSTHWG